jgi:hypothetical protein
LLSATWHRSGGKDTVTFLSYFVQFQLGGIPNQNEAMVLFDKFCRMVCSCSRSFVS